MRLTNLRELFGSFAGGRKGGKEGDHRHRMTEQEEDEECLVQDALERGVERRRGGRQEGAKKEEESVLGSELGQRLSDVGKARLGRFLHHAVIGHSTAPRATSSEALSLW